MGKMYPGLRLKSKTFGLMMAFVLAFAGLCAMPLVAHAEVGDDAPANEKKLTPNGDGTYTLSLSVTGATSSSTTTEATKANVILVIDTSNSMNGGSGETSEYVYTEFTGDGTQGAQYWGVDADGDYVRVYWRNSANPHWRLSNSNQGQVYTGTVYTRTGGEAISRLEAEKDALTKADGIIDNLLSQNVAGDPVKSDIIEVALVNFGTAGYSAHGFSTSASDLKSTINGLETNTGTNWEEALMRADEYADAIRGTQPNEQIYVIFLTDGEPTTHNGDYTVSIDYATEWGYANGRARDLVTDGDIFYGLFTWGSGTSSHYLSSLVQYAYTGSGNSNTELDSAYAQYFTDASSTEALIEALNQIVHNITNSVGYTDVEMTDGVTTMTASNVSLDASGEVTGVKYYRAGGPYSSTANDGLGEEWTDIPESAKATINDNGEVDWDLGDLILENGVTYTIAFVVWPSQESLDLIADLNNGIIDYDTDLTPDQKSQITGTPGSYTLKTNTDYPTITYSTVTTTQTDGGDPVIVVSDPTTVRIDNPDPVSLAEEQLNALKEWEDSLDPSQREEIEDVVLYLKVDGHYYYVDDAGNKMGVTLTEESGWTETNYISIAPGLMVTSDSPAYDATKPHVTWGGKEYALIEPGHEYVFEEDSINNHYELVAYTHHPMIMGTNADGTPHIFDVVFTKDASGNITGIESVSEMGDSLSATNTLKGGINIIKKVVGEDGEEVDDLNPFKVTVTMVDANGNALPTKTAADGTEYTIDYRIYYGPNNPNYDEAAGGGRSGHIYKTGTSFSETIYVGDTIRVVNVEEGTVYTVEEVEADVPVGYEYDSTTYEIAYAGLEANRKADPDHTVQRNSASYAEVVNKYTYGDLEVAKTVTVPAGFTVDEDAKFTFTFKLYTDDTKATERTGLKFKYTKGDEKGTIEEGGTFTLKDGETFLIEKLPEANYYEIVESTPLPAGYKLDSKTGDTGTIVKNETAEASFTNAYSASGVVDPPVQKIIENNDDLYNGGDFTFTIEGTSAPEGVSAPLPATTSITNSETYEKDGKTGYYEFGEITFTVPGTYVYTITESGSVAGVTNDSDAEKGKTITFKVTDNGDGTLDIDPATDEVELAFTNTYDATGSATLKVTKKLAGAAWPANQTLTITLAGTGDAPMPETTTATLSAAGDVEFGPIAYTLADDGKEYTYTITESSFGTGWTGSPTSITAKVKVEDDGEGEMTTTITYDPKDATFTNTYLAEGEVSFPVQKVLSVPQGMEGPESWSYTFNVTPGEGAPTATSMSATVNQDADTATFGPFKFDQTAIGKTYTYTVTETGEVDGVENDSAAATGKTVTVAVSDAGSGKLSFDVSSTAQSPLTFTNTYNTEPTTYELKAAKVLAVTPPANNPPTVDGKYTLTLTATGDAPMPKDATDGKVEITNADGAGTATSFGAIEFEKPGEFQYTVSESGTVSGVTNGQESYTVKVKVSDEGDGTLGVEVTEGKQVTTFTNTYKVSDATLASLDVTKSLTGAKLKGGAFSFEVANTLKPATVETAPLPNPTTASNDADGKVAFGSMTFDTPGTYKYAITEINGGQTIDGVTYDDLEVTATVTVEDNGEGKLVATVEYSDDTEFNNTYEASGEFIPSVKKKLEGFRALEADQFTFELLDEDGEVIDTATNAADGSVTFEKITYDQTIFDDDDEGGSEDEGAESGDAGKRAAAAPADEADATAADEDDTAADEGEEPGAEGDVEADAEEEGEEPDAEGEPEADASEPEPEPGLESVQIVDPDPEPAAEPTIFKAVESAEAYEPDVEAVNGAPDSVIVVDDVAAPAANEAPVLRAEGDDESDEEEEGEVRSKTFTYTIREVDGGKPGYTYDGKTVTVTVTVTDNGDGTLDVDEDWSDDEPFINTYEAEGRIELEGSKTVTGTELEEGQFSFNLKEGNDVLDTQKNDAKGGFTFAAINYTKPGTYEYTIVEVNDGKTGYTYDDHVCTVTVTVTDNGDGTLGAVAKYSDGEKASFENPYDPLDTSAPFKAAKKLEGRDLKAGEFSFELVDADGKVVKTATNAADGSVDFGYVTFDKAGNFAFTALEVKGSDATITYDASQYTYKVEVVDDGGQLKATVTCDAGDVPTFKNKYTPEEPPVIPITGDNLPIVALVGVAIAAAAVGIVAVRRRSAAAAEVKRAGAHARRK